jgi:magnesium-transporting ATPase (P-type)
MKILDEVEVKEYVEEFKKADDDFENREQRLTEIADKMERNLVLLGTTVVEDRLQDEVPEMI